MKYLYSFLLMAAAATFSSTAAQKTFTINVDNPDQVYVRDRDNDFHPFIWNNGSVTVTTEDTYELPVQTVDSRNYLLSSITDQFGNNVSTIPSTSFPTASTNLKVSLVPDGGTVTITTQEKEPKHFTFIGNPEQVTITMDYNEQTPSGGMWVITPEDYSSIKISAKAGSMLRSVTDSYGTSLSIYNNTASITAHDYQTDQTFTITSVDEAEIRTASFTVVVDGSYGQVQIVRNADQHNISLAGNSTVVNFDPDSETSYTFSHMVYGKSLYAVTVDGDPALAQGTSWKVNVHDGSVVNVTTDFPDVDVPVNFSFTNEGTEDVIRSVLVNGIYTSSWNSPDFTVKMGATLNIEVNNTDYDITSATLNGQSIQSNYFQCTVTSADPLNFVYTATKKQPYSVTIETDCPEGLVIYNGYGTYGTLIPAEFNTDGIAIVEIPQSDPYIYIAGADGYVIAAIEAGSEIYQPGNAIYVSSDMELYVSAEPLVRDRTLTLYVQPGSWNYRNFSTAFGTALSQSYQDSLLPTGYNTIMFGRYDFPFYVTGYPALYAYHNGEEIALQYGSGYVYTAADGDVIKMFYQEPSTYSVTYDIDPDIAVEVRHDRTLLIENPSGHTVVGPTEVHIIPAEAASRQANSKIFVKVNGVPVAPEDGKYVTMVTSDTYISVEPDMSSAIESVTAPDAEDATIYNLQGIPVDNSTLPAGIYIVNGKKVIR